MYKKYKENTAINGVLYKIPTKISKRKKVNKHTLSQHHLPPRWEDIEKGRKAGDECELKGKQKDKNMRNYKPRLPPRVNLDLIAHAHPTQIEKARDSENEVV